MIAFGSGFYLSNFTWVPGLKPRLPGSNGKFFYPLSQLPSPPLCVCVCNFYQITHSAGRARPLDAATVGFRFQKNLGNREST